MKFPLNRGFLSIVELTMFQRLTIHQGKTSQPEVETGSHPEYEKH